MQGPPEEREGAIARRASVAEKELYRTGMGEYIVFNIAYASYTHGGYAEVIDLTHPRNVELFREWVQKEAGYLQQQRFIRISSATPETVILTRIGQHALLKRAEQQKKDAEEAAATMDTDEPPLLAPAQQFSSTIQGMDGE